MQSRTVFTGHFAERYAPRLGRTLLPNQKVCGPALALLEKLADHGVLRKAEKPMRCKCENCVEITSQTAYTAWDPCVPSIAVALRLLQLRESRCVYYVPDAEDPSEDGYERPRSAASSNLLDAQPEED